MRVSLGILAGGAFLTWLLFGGMSRLFASTLPFHELEHESLAHMIIAISTAPSTWFALLIVGIGFIVFWVRARGFKLFGGGWLDPFVESSFGLESINRFVVKGTYKIAEGFSATQTGELNWNILGILCALLAVLLVLWLGA